MATFRLKQAGGGISERAARPVMSRATHHEIHHTAQETGGRNDLLEKEKEIKLSEIKMEENDAVRTCGTNSVRDIEKDKCIRKVHLKAATRIKKKKAFRRPLKKERLEFRNEFIEYNADFPNRVGIRLEYLMGSTKVHLNDRQYMDRLYLAMSKEEELNIRKTEYDREKVEIERVKKLVVEGEMTPPQELTYLYEHPVFRVNKMLRRLDVHDGSLHTIQATDNQQMTLCEPFEYDGRRFFEHLHETGHRDWVPRSVREEQKKLYKEKVQRARERRRIARNAAEEEEEVRLLYKNKEKDADRKGINDGPNDDFDIGDMFGSNSNSDNEDQEKQAEEGGENGDPDEEEDAAEDNKAVQKKRRARQDQTLAAPTPGDPNGSRTKRGMSEEPLNCRLVVEQMLAEHIEHRELELARKRLYRQKEEYEEQKERERELERRKRVAEAIEAHESKSSKTILCIDEPVTPVNLEEDDSLELLRKSYQIKGGACIGQYRSPRDLIISTYIDDVEDPDELFENGKEVKLLYQREQRVCEDFIRKLNQYR